MNDFGAYIRDARTRLEQSDRSKCSLRQVAHRIELEPAYLSKVERGLVPPPSEKKIVKLAEELGEDKDILLALAGKVSEDLLNIIRKRPKLFAEILHELERASDDAILRIVREVKDGDW